MIRFFFLFQGFGDIDYDYNEDTDIAPITKVSIIQITEALKSVMCDVIKIRLKRRDANRSKIK